jgi:hypothetical protein
LSDALDRIIDARSIKNLDDRAYLFNLMAMMAVKNPRFRENIRQFQEKIIKQMMALMTATPERWASQTRRAEGEGAVLPDPGADYQTIREFVEADKYKITIATGWHLVTEMNSLDAVLPFFFERKWVLFRASPSRTGFVTSDHPVCLMWSDPKERGKFFGPGFGMARTQIVFPISNELAVIGAFEVHEEERDAPDWLIAQINGSIALHADRQIYARHSNFMWKLTHNTRIMRGDELLADQAQRLRAASTGSRP